MLIYNGLKFTSSNGDALTQSHIFEGEISITHKRPEEEERKRGKIPKKNHKNISDPCENQQGHNCKLAR